MSIALARVAEELPTGPGMGIRLATPHPELTGQVSGS